MIFQDNLRDVIECFRCKKREVGDFLSDKHGIKGEDDAVISLPFGWYF